MRTHAAERQVINPAHVAALSVAIAVHLVGVGLLLRPMSLPQLPEAVQEMQVVFLDPFRQPPPPPLPPEPTPLREVVRATPQPVVHAVQQPPLPHVSQASEATVQATEVDTTTEAVVESITPPTVPQQEAIAAPPGLVVVNGPRPPYPADALRAGIQGEVVLMVSVDANGRPTGVEVLQSSGNRALDRAAQQHVLKRWTFQATGVAQSARLPIRFSIQ